MDSSGVRRYRRIGKVGAHQLTASRRWQSERQLGTDSFLESAPGDWWVTSPDGGGRGVAAGEFDELYERWPVDPAGVYRRKGEVDAYQASEPGSVTTLEGTASYSAGDWIVSTSPTNVWPVTDEVFRASYVERDEESQTP